MRYPKNLADGSAIGFVAPSFGCAADPYMSAFRSALAQFENMGHPADLGPNCFESSGYGISNAPDLCGKEFTQWYCRKENGALVSCGGGELMCEVIEYIDWDRIAAADPKWFMGYSDNTNITFLLTTLCDTASIYAPCASDFGMTRWHPAVRDAYDALRGKRRFKSYGCWESSPAKDKDHPLLPYNCTEIYSHRIFDSSGGETKAAVFEGRLLGGCLDCLQLFCGTEFDKVKDFNGRYADDGVLWFFDICDLSPMGARRALLQLKRCGWFDTARAFMVGRPLNYDDGSGGEDWIKCTAGALSSLGVPVLLNTDIGHLPPMIPMISGSYAKVRCTSGVEIEYLEI